MKFAIKEIKSVKEELRESRIEIEKIKETMNKTETVQTETQTETVQTETAQPETLDKKDDKEDDSSYDSEPIYD